MDDFFADYMDQAMEQVRWRRARPALAQELRTHLLERIDTICTCTADTVCWTVPAASTS